LTFGTGWLEQKSVTPTTLQKKTIIPLLTLTVRNSIAFFKGEQLTLLVVESNRQMTNELFHTRAILLRQEILLSSDCSKIFSIFCDIFLLNWAGMFFCGIT
jgi:hypothetical protein